jgi:hypothetical protein
MTVPGDLRAFENGEGLQACLVSCTKTFTYTKLAPCGGYEENLWLEAL